MIESRMIAIDSMVLVWGVRKRGDTELVRRAAWLFDSLEDEEAQIVVPSVAVAEFLSYSEPAAHAGQLAALAERFLIMPFDSRSAALAAHLWRIGNSDRKKKAERSRQCLRADSLIVASAKSCGARIFVSNDGKCRRLCEKAGLKAVDLPTMPKTLFEF